MRARLSHAAVVVPDLEEACRFYGALVGAESVRVMAIPELGLRNAFVQLGTRVYFELVEMDDGEPMRVLGEQLAHGQQMMCFECEDLPATVATLREAGHEVIDLPRSDATPTLPFDRAWVRRRVRGDFPMELVPSGAVAALVDSSTEVALADL